MRLHGFHFFNRFLHNIAKIIITIFYFKNSKGLVIERPLLWHVVFFNHHVLTESADFTVEPFQPHQTIQQYILSGE